MKILILGCILGLVLFVISIEGSTNDDLNKRNRHRRGFGEVYDLFGSSKQAAINEIYGAHNIAMLSAQSAVTSSIGQVYGDHQANFADAVNQFLIPLKKYQQQNHQSHSYGQEYNNDILHSQESFDSKFEPYHAVQSNRIEDTKFAKTGNRNVRHRRRQNKFSRKLKPILRSQNNSRFDNH